MMICVVLRNEMYIFADDYVTIKTRSVRIVNQKEIGRGLRVDGNRAVRIG
jgi:hypothetical protein